ncbi:MAG TPA: hypothetical protein VMO17_22585 [Terriglobia bacterium]|nr:hypothetical protein [Terriglobia bacterium]
MKLRPFVIRSHHPSIYPMKTDSGLQTHRSPAQFCMTLALMLLGSLTLNLVFCVAGFFAGKPISILQPSVAIAVSLILPPLFLYRRGRWSQTRIAFLCLSYCAILVIPILVAAQFRDVTCDGQTYQGSAVAKLAAGWNPVRDPENIDPVPYDWTLNNILRFPKGHWIAEAAIVKVTGNLEAGKALHLILAALSFLLVLSLLVQLGRSSPAVSVTLALLVSLNPVTANQCLSYYNDGQVCSLLISFVACSIYLIVRYGTIPLLLLAMITLNLSNMKFGALGLLVILGLVYCAALLIVRPSVPIFRVVSVFLGSLAVGVLLIGCNPYIVNFKLGGRPFYPFNRFTMANPMWAAQEIHQTPANFRGRGPVHTLLLSIFSRSSNEFIAEGRTVGPGHLKIPFTVSRSELETFTDVDAKVGGWGPLFGGIILLTAAAVLLLFRRRQPTGPFATLLVLIGAVALSILILPDHWNARYAPHLCLIPLATTIYIFSWETRRLRTLARIIAGAMALNVVLIAAPCFRSTYIKTKVLNRQLSQLVTSQNPVPVCFGELHFNRARFRSLGIDFREIPPPPNDPGTPLEGHVPAAQTTIYPDLP